MKYIPSPTITRNDQNDNHTFGTIELGGSRIRHGDKHHFCNDVYPQFLRVAAIIPGKSTGQIQSETEISRPI